VRAVWQQRRPVNATTQEQLRAQAWAMFDHGFSNYMKHAFPQVSSRAVQLQRIQPSRGHCNGG
jgi:hypothetical protein